MGTKKEIHTLADAKGIAWDNDSSFKSWSKGITGKAHLDDMSPEELTKLKKALNKRDEQKTAASRDDLKKVTLQNLGITAGVGAAVAGANTFKPGDLTGRYALYHGTDDLTAEKIRSEGLLPKSRKRRKAPSISNILDDATQKAGKDLVFVTNRSGNFLGGLGSARSYAGQQELIKKHLKKGLPIGEAIPAARAEQLLNLGYGGGSVIKMRVPLEEMRSAGKVVRNPEVVTRLRESAAQHGPNHFQHKIDKALWESMVGEKGGTYAIKDGVPTKYIKGSDDYIPLTLREAVKHMKANPKLVSKGVGSLALGLGGAGLAASQLKKSFSKEKSAEADLSITSPLDVLKTVGTAGAVGKWGGVIGGFITGRNAREVLKQDAAPERMQDLIQKAKKTHPGVRVVLGNPSTAEDILSITSPLKLKIKELRTGSPEKARSAVVEKFLQKQKGFENLGLNPSGPMYVPKTNTVFLANSNSPMVLAHELGHASGGLGKKILQSSPVRLGVTGLGIGAALKALSDIKAADKSTDAGEQAELLRSGRNFATASAAGLAGPILLEEARANMHALKAAPAGSRMALLKKLSPGFSSYAAKRLPAAFALPLALELLRRKASKSKEKSASLSKAWSFLKSLPADEAAATIVGGIGGGPIPGSSLAALATYRGAKNVIKIGPPGSAQRKIALKIREMKKADADWDALVKGKGPWGMNKTGSMKSHTDGALATKKRDSRERFARVSAFGAGFAAPVSAGWVGKKTVSGPFSGKSFTGISEIAAAARPGDLLMVGQSNPVDMGRTIISLGTGMPHGYHAAIVAETSTKKGTVTILDLTPKGYRRKEISTQDLKHYSLFRPKSEAVAKRAHKNMSDLVALQNRLVSELKKNGVSDSAIRKITADMYVHKMNPVIGVRELFIPYVKDMSDVNERAVKRTERNIGMLKSNIIDIAKDIARDYKGEGNVPKGRFSTEALAPMKNVCTNTAAMVGIPVGPRSRATWAGPNDFLRSGKLTNVGFRVSGKTRIGGKTVKYSAFAKYFDSLLVASPHLIRAGVGVALGSTMAGYVAAKQWTKKKKNRRLARKGFRFKRQIFIKGYTRSDGRIVKSHMKTASIEDIRTSSYQRGLARAASVMGLIGA